MTRGTHTVTRIATAGVAAAVADTAMGIAGATITTTVTGVGITGTTASAVAAAPATDAVVARARRWLPSSLLRC